MKDLFQLYKDDTVIVDPFLSKSKDPLYNVNKIYNLCGVVSEMHLYEGKVAKVVEAHMPHSGTFNTNLHKDIKFHYYSVSIDLDDNWYNWSNIMLYKADQDYLMKALFYGLINKEQYERMIQICESIQTENQSL